MLQYLNGQQLFKGFKPLKSLIFISIFISIQSLEAQEPLSNKSIFNLTNQRILNLQITSDTLVQDSLTIIPNSIQIFDYQTNTYLDSTYFSLNKNLILLKNKPLILSTKLDSIRLTYRVFPYNLNKKYYRIDSSQINPLAPEILVEFEYNTEGVTNAPIFEKGLEYNGNYTQGLSVGNAQNLVVNQNFNLNLAGKLGDLDILASMTDNNLPIQAEGNTQSLREIDKIFIQLKKGNNTLVAGDYELNRPLNTYFLNYSKKLQGLSFTNKTPLLLKKNLTTPQSGNLFTKANIGIARGKFARNILPVQEGNQGPYKLFGTEGASFFIILSGTEKVFFDGKLLVRGDENDYIMDYNRGDIVFTPKRFITKDSRVIVEFEYADQSYLRSTASLSNELIYKKLRLNFNFYTEQDSKNSTGTQALDSLDKAVLRRSGNDFDNNAPLSIRAADDGFRSDRIQYKLVDTVVNKILYEKVLVYSANPDSAKFTATFTPVGEGKGNYIQVPTAANGRVYQWVAPDSGKILRGSFEPIRKLVPPNRQQVMTLGLDYQLFKYTHFFTEVALSNNDRNRFSTIGDSANVGLAVFTGFSNRVEFGQKQSWAFETTVKTELTQKNFKALNPYRSAEFTRDWNIGTVASGTNNTIGNLNQNQTAASEVFLNGNILLSKRDWFSMSYDYGKYNRQFLYNGERHVGRINFNRNNWSITADANILNTESQPLILGGVKEKTNFTRPKLDLNKTFRNNIKLGAYAEREKNQRFDASKDTLTRASFYYDLWRIYAEIPLKSKVKKDSTDTPSETQNAGGFGINYSQRFDYQPITNRFFQISKVNELNVNGILNRNEHSQLTWNISYRDLKVNDTAKTTLTPQQTYLGRLEYNFNAFKNAIYANTLYEIGSGQEQKLEYQYVKVNKGEGQYIWKNRNADTIPQLDEFEIAPFADQADYVRVTLLTNQFIRTNNVSFSQSLRLDPRALWFEKKGFLKFMNLLSTNSSLQINRRVKNRPNTEGGERVSQWNPLDLKISDTTLVALNIAMRNSLFFNRSSPVWDFEVGQLDNRNRIVLVTGFEERGRDEWFLRSRLNISKSFALQNYFARGHQSNNSEAFKNRNYTVSLVKMEPELTWMIGADFRLVFAYKFKNGQNTLPNPSGIFNNERIKNNDISTEATWNNSTNAQLRTKFSFVQVAYTGERNTPLEFALLEGLQNGKNFLWNLSLDRVLSKNIFLNLTYEGRKTGVVRTVHVGRAAVRANF